MPLHMFKAVTTGGGQEALYKQLEKNHTDSRNQKHIFIVPERFTLCVERSICALDAFKSGFFNVDVLTFSRMAAKLLPKTVKTLSKEGTVLLLSKVIRENAEKLQYYKDMRGYNFSKELFAALAQLRMSNVTVEDLLKAADNGALSDSAKKKTGDLAIILDEYQKSLQNGQFDTITRLDALINGGLDALKNTHIYISGFNIYSEQQLSLIKRLINICPTVNMYYTAGYDNDGKNKRIFPTKQAELLKEYARVREEILADGKNLDEPFKYIYGNMFGEYIVKNRERVDPYASRLSVSREENAFLEVSSVAREIVNLLKNGADIKDFAIICNNEEYYPVISRTFSRCGIPYFIDENYYLKDGMIARFLFDTLYAAVFLSSENVLRLSRSPLLNLSREEISAFTAYIRVNNICRFRQPFGEEIAETVRQKVLEIIGLVPTGHTKLSEFCDAALEILKRADSGIIEKFSSGTDPVLRASVSTDEFIEIIEETKMICGEDIAAVDEFINIIINATADTKHALLPDCVNSVFIGNTSDSRITHVKYLFIMGASGGFFPKKAGEGLIFSYSDYIEFEKAGIKISPSILESNGLERFSALDAFTKADKIYLSYAEKNFKGETLSPDEAVIEVSHILFGDGNNLTKLSDNKPLEYLLVNDENALYEYYNDGIPHIYRETVKEYLERKGLLTAENEYAQADSLCVPLIKTNDKGQYVSSVTRIEQYFKCPYAYFLQCVLSLEKPTDGDIDAMEAGSLIHKVLEDFFNAYISDSEYAVKNIENIVNAAFISQGFDMKKLNPINRHRLQKLYEECIEVIKALVRDTEIDDFKPKAVEISFEEKDNLTISVETADGIKTVFFRGKVDRLDTKTDKDEILARIIDYKTGTTTAGLKEVFYGRKMQLYLYLRHFMEKGYTPAGCVYIPVKTGYVKDGRSFAPVGQKISGKFSADDFRIISYYVTKLLESNLSDMFDGFIKRSPVDGACERCDYSRMCGEVRTRKMSKKDSEDFATAVFSEKKRGTAGGGTCE